MSSPSFSTWLFGRIWYNNKQNMQVHPDEYIKNVKLQLFVLIAKQPAFDQLRSVEQLGYITSLSRTYANTSHLNTLWISLLLETCGTSIQFSFTAETNVMLLNCRSDAGVRGLQLIVQSSVKVNTSYLLYVSQQRNIIKILLLQYERLMVSHNTGS